MKGAYGGYGGYGGFENEAYRQNSLAGRNFSGFLREQRTKQFHQTNVACLNGTDSAPSPAPSYSRHTLVTAGEKTHQGIPREPYHLLTGSNMEATGVGPHFDRFSKRVPGHQLPSEQAKQLAGEGAPGPTKLGVGPTRREYVDMGMAMAPAGAGGVNQVKGETATEYQSYTELTTDRNKHARMLNEPQAKAELPQTSAQMYGWSPTGKQPPPQNYNKKCCRETRFAQSVMLGARHKGGYSGQGTL